MDNPNIYNIKGDNRLSLGLQPLTTRNAIIIRVFFQSGSVIVFTVSEIIIFIFFLYISFFSSINQKIPVFKHLRVVSVY